MLAGGYPLRRAKGGLAVTLVGMGAVIPELLRAADTLGRHDRGDLPDERGPAPPRLPARAGFGEHPTEILDELFPAERAAPMVTVLDGDPNALPSSPR